MMKKDREWVFTELGKLSPSYAEIRDQPDDITIMESELLNKVYDILSQLDESEVPNHITETITRAIDVETTSKTIEALTGMTIEQVAEGFRDGKLETSAPLIVPEDIGVWLEDIGIGETGRYFTMIDALFHYWDTRVGSPIGDFISENKKELIEIILGNRGYEVEEVPKYHALIKGFELVSGYDIYWNYDKSDCSVFVSRLHPPHDNFITEMTEQEWFVIGIDDSNAHFVEVGN